MRFFRRAFDQKRFQKNFFLYYPMLSEHLRETFFEYDIKKDMLLFSPGNPFALPETTHGFLKQCRQGRLHPPASFLEQIYLCVRQGAGLWQSSSFSVMAEEKKYWLKMEWVKVCSSRLCIGRVADISQIKEEQDCLIRRAKNDGLTGLLNKTTAGELCREFLTANIDAPCALLMIDVDDFKQVNDKYGHPYGDYILHTIADKIKSIFGEKSIVGRFGGDEFLVFLKEYETLGTLCRETDQLCKQVAAMSEEEECEIACSVGVALRNRRQNFDRLFQQADRALYDAKGQGKNRFCIADEGPAAELCKERPVLEDPLQSLQAVL